MSLGSTLSKTIWPFSPQSIPNLLLWVDAADTTSYTPSTAITTCRNKGYSSGSLSVTGTVNATSTTINSLPTFAFAASAFMVCPSLVFLQTTRTAFVVVNIGASGTIRYFMVGGSNSLDTQFYSYSTDLELNYSGHNNYVAASPSPMFSTTSLLCATTLSTNGGLFINGTAQTLTTNTPLAYATGTSTTQQLGASGTGTFTLGEAMIFDGAITDIQRQHIEGYLAKKWGLQALLPASHPYYNNATWGVSHPFNRIFQPPDITGLQLWLDAADAGSVTGTTSVTNVADKSGNNVVLSSATGFSYPNNTFNGGKYPSFYNPISALSGTGSNYTLGINNSFAQTTPFTVFFVAHYTAGASFSGYIIDSGTTSTGRPYTYQQNISTPFGNASTSVLASPCVISMNWIAGTSSQVYVNGTLNYNASISLTGFTTTGITVGNRFSLNESWPGHICELVWYSGTLNSNLRQQVEQYLAWKWGLTSSFGVGHPGKTLPAFQTMFSPKSISGLQLWLDAADSTSITLSGSNVTAWADKSGNGRNGTATSTVTLGNNINGVQSMVLNRSGYFRGAISITTPGLTCFAVATTTLALPLSGSDQRLVSITAGAQLDYNNTQSAIVLFNQSTTSTIQTYRNNGGVVSNAIVQNVPFMVATQLDITNLLGTMWFNGSLSGTGGTATGNFAATAYGIANDAANQTGEYWQGYIGEIIMYNVILTTSQRQQVEGYLAQKWRLTANLPTTHAYKKNLS